MNTVFVSSEVFGHGRQGDSTKDLSVHSNTHGVAQISSNAFPLTHATPSNITQSQTLMEQLNQKLYPQGLQAVFQYDNKSHMTWLNVVNKATGQVVDRYPPEKIREMVDAAANAGLSYDKRL